MAGNPYHDAEGQFCSRNEMQGAIDKLAASGDLDGYFKLRTELEEIDKTSTVKKQVKETTEPVKSRKNEDGLTDTIDMSLNPEWEPAETKSLEGSYGSPKRIGEKYDGYRDITLIAKDIRADIKEAIDGKYLPADLEYSVRTDKGGWTSSVRVVVKGLSDKAIMNSDDRYTADARLLADRIDAIASQYNSQESAPQVDYFSYAFYSHVELESEYSKNYRVKEAAAAKRVAASKKQRVNIASKIKANPSVLPSLLSSSSEPFQGGERIGRIKDSNLFVSYEEVEPGKIRTYRAWDLSYLHDAEENKESDAEIFTRLHRNRLTSATLRRKEFKL